MKSQKNTDTPSECCQCEHEKVSTARRKLIRGIGWGALFSTVGLTTAGALRFFSPRVLFELPSAFKIGVSGDYPSGDTDKHGVISVNEKFMDLQRVWIVRETDRIYAIFAKCTHLGCTPRWFPDDRQFKCPCHGSKYYSTGENFAGPAPRPMDRYAIQQLEDGRIVVDKSELYTFEQFDDTRSFVKSA